MNSASDSTGHFPRVGPIGLVLILILLTLCTTLPGIGRASLWDIDEGLHAACAMEMHEANNWIIPTFNYKLFSDKPVLMYWLDRICFAFGGVNEAMARLPMALATLITVLATALIAWDMAPKEQKFLTALLSGLIVATSISVIVAARFVNPDSLLCASISGSLAVFWVFQARRSSHWLWVAAIFTGLGMLAKGPVGVVVPGGIVFFFLVIQGRWKELFAPHLLTGILVWCAIAFPWYIYVGVETHFEFIHDFFFKHNVGRFSAPMESHGGPPWYYIPVLLIGFAPWSIFLTPTIWTAGKLAQEPAATEGAPTGREKLLFLGIWACLVFGLFSVTATKLPNYIMPAFPPLAILTASYLVRRALGVDGLPAWVWPACYGCLALVGIITMVGLLIASGMIPVQGAKMRIFPGLEYWTWLGLIPLGTLAGMLALKNRPMPQLATLSLGAILFSGSFGIWNGSSLNPYKAPDHLAAAVPAGQLGREVQFCTFGWFQPSIVFYCKREVRPFEEHQLAEIEGFLAAPRESYLFTTDQLAAKLQERGWNMVELTMQYDFYKNAKVGTWRISREPLDPQWVNAIKDAQ